MQPNKQKRKYCTRVKFESIDEVVLPIVEQKNNLSQVEEKKQLLSWKDLIQLRNPFSWGLSIQTKSSRSISTDCSIVKSLKSNMIPKEKNIMGFLDDNKVYQWNISDYLKYSFPRKNPILKESSDRWVPSFLLMRRLRQNDRERFNSDSICESALE